MVRNSLDDLLEDLWGYGDKEKSRAERFVKLIISNSSDETMEQNETVSGEDPDVYTFWLYQVIVPCICIPGILGSICVIIVMSRRPHMISRMNVLLMGLAVFDLLLLILALILYPSYGECVIKDMRGCAHLGTLNDVIYPPLMTAKTASNWTCVCISLDRYIVICHPLIVKGNWTVERAKKLLVIVAVASALYNFPTVFHSQEKVLISFWYQNLYQTYFYFIFLLIIPVGSMIILNLLCIREMRMADRRADRRLSTGIEEDNLSEARRRVTLIAVCVVATFIVFNLLAFATRVVSAIAGSGFLSWSGKAKDNFIMTQMTGNALVLLNSATNFVIYCVLSNRFRKTFLDTFCPWCVRIHRRMIHYDSVETDLR